MNSFCALKPCQSLKLRLSALLPTHPDFSKGSQSVFTRPSLILLRVLIVCCVKELKQHFEVLTHLCCYNTILKQHSCCEVAHLIEVLFCEVYFQPFCIILCLFLIVHNTFFIAIIGVSITHTTVLKYYIGKSK